MRLLAVTPIAHPPHPDTGSLKSTRGSAPIGGPRRISEKAHRYHEQPRHTVLHLPADAGGLTDALHRAGLELFPSDIAPAPRREIPDPPWTWGQVIPASAVPPNA